LFLNNGLLFHKQKTNKQIITGLADSDISESTLKRRLKQFGLFRGKKGENIEEIVDILAEEIVVVGWNRGYRRLKNVLETKHNVRATQ
jgi:transcription antitermination factor NusA-like protein